MNKRYIVDGTDKVGGWILQSEDATAPYLVFDIEAQDWINRPFPVRLYAQVYALYLNLKNSFRGGR